MDFRIALLVALSFSTFAGLAFADRWRPSKTTNMFYQLGKAFNLKVDIKKNVTAYAIDGFNTPAATVKAMRKAKLHAVCYISAGSVESYRPDKTVFPAAVVGKPLDGWPDENWLDIRAPVVRRIMEKRIKMCRDKGFVAVDPDNVDAYDNPTGFPLTFKDQLAYNKFLADTAHKYGLSIGLKNDISQIAALQPWFDFAVNEQCWVYNECGEYAPFIKAGKPVYNIEYSPADDKKFQKTICPKSNKLGIKTSKHRMKLDGWWLPCSNAH